MRSKQNLLWLLLTTLPFPALAKYYPILSYSEFIYEVRKIASENQDIMRLTEGSEMYKDLLPPSACKNEQMAYPIIHVTNYDKSDDAINSLAQVFYIGPVHGDEVVGAFTLLAFLQKIAEEKTKRFWDMLNTRMLVILPLPNSQGFCRLNRGQNSLDVNRDFPYGVEPKACMNTPAARLINELVREHLFISSFTYHGGDNSISYPWGSPAHKDNSPDNTAFSEVAKDLVEVAGEYNILNVEKYTEGSMSDTVYAVNGGLEDWIYAASWDKSQIEPCLPKVSPNYPKQKTIYNDNSHRVFIYLVEAGFNKQPTSAAMGEMDGWHNRGHVSRNLVMAKRLSDLTRPEVILKSYYYDKVPNTGNFEIVVQGCLKIDKLHADFSILTEPALDESKISMDYFHCQPDVPCKLEVILSNAKYISPRIKVDCDFSWTADPNPQSHFVRMRTRSYYVAENNGFRLQITKGFFRTSQLFDVQDTVLFSTVSDNKASVAKQGSLVQGVGVESVVPYVDWHQGRGKGREFSIIVMSVDSSDGQDENGERITLRIQSDQRGISLFSGELYLSKQAAIINPTKLNVNKGMMKCSIGDYERMRLGVFVRFGKDNHLYFVRSKDSTPESLKIEPTHSTILKDFSYFSIQLIQSEEELNAKYLNNPSPNRWKIGGSISPSSSLSSGFELWLADPSTPSRIHLGTIPASTFVSAQDFNIDHTGQINPGSHLTLTINGQIFGHGLLISGNDWTWERRSRQRPERSQELNREQKIMGVGVVFCGLVSIIFLAMLIVIRIRARRRSTNCYQPLLEIAKSL